MAKLEKTTHRTQSAEWDSIRRFDSREGNVAKLVFDQKPKNGRRPAIAEAVLYRYPTYRERTVICCSTQSGCPMGCRFCGAGDYFVRSLTAAEIADQVSHAISETDIAPEMIKKFQIMFMSMGEPALNQRHLADAIRRLNALYPHARLLISTSAPDVSYDEIFRISRDIAAVGLQFSVHESTDAARARLIPFAKKMTLRKIAATGNAWFETTGRKPFFNYCAHDGNSSAEDAGRLLALFDPRIWEATISVVCERNEGLPARNEHQLSLARRMAQLLLEKGFNTRIFDPAGQDDIGGGCGQLWYVQEKMRVLAPLGLASPSAGHGLETVHTPGNA